jgi:predicted amidohydrolase YtcJ
MTRFAPCHLLAVLIILSSCFAANPAAERVFRNATIFTADDQGSVVEAIAIREGRIIYVGTNAGVAPFIGSATRVTDLKGGFLMPGLIDGHLHPLEAGLKLQKCSLNYESLTVAEMQKRIQACLDKTKDQEPDGWLEVVSWFQESMRPAGVKTSCATLDVLKTSRPIIVNSSFGHTALANSRALALAKITKDTPDPLGGKIWHGSDGNPTGLLEDSAYAVFSTLIPRPTAEQNIAAAKAAQQALNQQGVTSFLDADAAAEDMAAFTAVQAARELTARAHFAPEIAVDEGSDPVRAVANVVRYAKQYDQGTI